MVSKSQLFEALRIGSVELVREALQEAVPLGLDRPFNERQKKAQDRSMVGAMAEAGARLWRGLARARTLRRSPGLLRKKSNTPLMVAAFYGQTELVRLLLPFSDPLARRGYDQETALMLAADSCNPECLKLLLPMSDPLATSKDGATALMRVVEHAASKSERLYDCVNVLLPISNVKAVHAPSEQTALMRAVFHREAELVKRLLPHSNVEHKDRKGKTAWDLAFQARGFETSFPFSEPAVQRYWDCLDVMSQTVPLSKAMEVFDASRLGHPVPDGALMGLRARVEREALAQVVQSESALSARSEARSNGTSAQHRVGQGAVQEVAKDVEARDSRSAAMSSNRPNRRRL